MIPKLFRFFLLVFKMPFEWYPSLLFSRSKWPTNRMDKLRHTNRNYSFIFYAVLYYFLIYRNCICFEHFGSRYIVLVLKLKKKQTFQQLTYLMNARFDWRHRMCAVNFFFPFFCSSFLTKWLFIYLFIVVCLNKTEKPWFCFCLQSSECIDLCNEKQKQTNKKKIIIIIIPVCIILIELIYN